MPRKRKSTEITPITLKKQKKVVESVFETDEFENMVFVPNLDDSGDSGDETDPEITLNEFEEFLCTENYRQMSRNYNISQKKLEEFHEYAWVVGEKIYQEPLQDEILLSKKDENIILSSTPVQLFENFFSKDMKDLVISATRENDLKISLDDLNAFLGIIIFTTFNVRKSQRDYWSTDSFLRSHEVLSVMGVRNFELIKSKIKYHFPKDYNENDKVWRVRPLLEKFRQNIKQFTFFSTAISIDEMMVKYYGRLNIKQYIQSKPTKYGIKMWALCGVSGYLFDCDIYCGKNSDKNSNLANCALGSRVVLHMLRSLLNNIPRSKLSQYHLYIDNYFCSPDLLVHLKKAGLRVTGTVRENRIKEKNEVAKDAARGTWAVKHDENSGINFITVKDSKLVSVLSTAAGVTPQTNVFRYNPDQKRKVNIPFPNAFSAYNKFMGGVDIHDMYCNRVLPIIRSKKWTWVIFMRIIQSSITNALVLWNTVCPRNKKYTIKDFTISIAKAYMRRKSKKSIKHVCFLTNFRRYCTNVKKCGKRTMTICKGCQVYYCAQCFQNAHNN